VVSHVRPTRYTLRGAFGGRPFRLAFPTCALAGYLSFLVLARGGVGRRASGWLPYPVTLRARVFFDALFSILSGAFTVFLGILFGGPSLSGFSLFWVLVGGYARRALAQKSDRIFPRYPLARVAPLLNYPARGTWPTARPVRRGPSVSLGLPSLGRTFYLYLQYTRGWWGSLRIVVIIFGNFKLPGCYFGYGMGWDGLSGAVGAVGGALARTRGSRGVFKNVSAYYCLLLVAR
jgi:hypothetical protein